MNVSPNHILVVDDDRGLRRTLERILRGDYNVETVSGATEAKERLDQEAFNLALVDVRLRDGDGYTLCRDIRLRHPETDVILITGSMSEPDEKLFRSLEEGAFYFLFKPFDRRVLRALVDRCLRLQHERLAKERYAQTLAEDLEKARLFQFSLVPRTAVCSAGWRLEGRLLSCERLGGDLYQALTTDMAGVAFSISDVEGHGVRAAMLAGMLRSTLDAARRRAPEPERIGRELRSGLDFPEATGSATLVYGLLLPDGRMRFLNAGHPPLLWQSGGRVERLYATGTLLHPALGSQPLASREVALHPGDRLLAYTDGVFEACNPAGQELGIDRVQEVFAGCRDLSVADTLDTLLDAVRDHCGGRPFTDDVTLLLVERGGAEVGYEGI